ncbi:hypothetical protein MCETHM1_00832 [Flavobacteriaceae bacterium]
MRIKGQNVKLFIYTLYGILPVYVIINNLIIY